MHLKNILSASSKRCHLKDHFLRFWHSRIARSVAIVASGTAGAQAISMAFMPFITRLYGPEAFGLLGTFMAVAAIMTPLAALAYPIAIVLPEEEADAHGLVRLSLIVSGCIAALAFLIFALAEDWILSIFGAADISGFTLLIPFVMLFSAWQETAQQWLVRKKAFKGIARVSVAQSLLINITKSGMGLFYPFPGILIILQAAGIFINAFLFTAAARALPSTDKENNEKTTRVNLLWLAKRYCDFPLYRAPQIFLNAASQSLPVLMLAALSGPAAAGFYTLARTALSLPSMLLGQSVQSVFYPYLNEAVINRKNTSSLIIKATGALTLIGFFPFIIIILLGPMLFEWVFGKGWEVAGEYGQWLSIWLFFALINRPSVSAMPVFKMQGWFLSYEILSIAARAAAIGLGFFIFKSDLVAIILFSLVGAALNILLIFTAIRAAQRFDKKMDFER